MYNHEPEDFECPLCVVARGEETDMNARTDVVYETDTVVAYVSPKWWINNPGNIMVIPREHVENIYDISTELLCDIHAVGKKIALAVKEAYECDGISFRQHNEPAGNQKMWHFHLHVLPRWEGDELYLNHNNSRFVTSEERFPYAEKLRDYFLK